jgi:large subunit ribosomal protein L22
MEAVAKLRNCPMSARKMRMVAEIIRGKNVDQALNLLRFTKREAAGWMEKLLVSAIANWEFKQNMSANADDHSLFIKTVLVDEAGMLKRFRPAPHGRALRIRKRSNHVTLIVENKVPLEVDLVTTDEEE